MRVIVRRLTGFFSSGIPAQDSAPNKSLDLSQSMDRPTEKMDAKFIEAVGLFDELDKMVNKYAMTVWNLYGDHFAELANIVSDNVLYAKVVKLMGNRTNAATLDFSEILHEEIETQLKAAAAISIGCELNELDLININGLCDQVLSLSESRDQLYDDLKTEMNTIAPNLTALVGELVGARLIAHGGGLLNLATQPICKIQSIGKPRYRPPKKLRGSFRIGIIGDDSLICKASPKNKGKMARSLAAKIALAIRHDALGDAQDNTMGLETRAGLEARLRNLEDRSLARCAETHNPSAADGVLGTPGVFETKIKKKRTKRYPAEKEEKVLETEEDAQNQNEKP
ncbi:hypothetical protein MKW92_026697 [Papaver armeniacum]|nr:hypothetical protein MKW92_026697 [Papaver armeniacum]